jgi:hypothetical protein
MWARRVPSCALFMRIASKNKRQAAARPASFADDSIRSISDAVQSDVRVPVPEFVMSVTSRHWRGMTFRHPDGGRLRSVQPSVKHLQGGAARHSEPEQLSSPLGTARIASVSSTRHVRGGNARARISSRPGTSASPLGRRDIKSAAFLLMAHTKAVVGAR